MISRTKEYEYMSNQLGTKVTNAKEVDNASKEKGVQWRHTNMKRKDIPDRTEQVRKKMKKNFHAKGKGEEMDRARGWEAGKKVIVQMGG